MLGLVALGVAGAIIAANKGKLKRIFGRAGNLILPAQSTAFQCGSRCDLSLGWMLLNPFLSSPRPLGEDSPATS